LGPRSLGNSGIPPKTKGCPLQISGRNSKNSEKCLRCAHRAFDIRTAGSSKKGPRAGTEEAVMEENSNEALTSTLARNPAADLLQIANRRYSAQSVIVASRERGNE
jgi:hypothetical protein